MILSGDLEPHFGCDSTGRNGNYIGPIFKKDLMKEYDLIVIGGGRASNLAFAAGKAEKRVALIEKDRLGGTCPNRGCVPSKLLIGYAEAARRVREAGRHFISAKIDRIDIERMIAETNGWIEGVDGRYEGRLPEGADLYRGTGRFVADHVVEVNGERLTAPRIVIATGTRPRPAPFPEVPAWTSDDLFPLKGNIPRSITIVGGGFIHRRHDHGELPGLWHQPVGRQCGLRRHRR